VVFALLPRGGRDPLSLQQAAGKCLLWAAGWSKLSTMNHPTDKLCAQDADDLKPGNTFPADHFGVLADLVLGE
jgi:hypothetical protein